MISSYDNIEQCIIISTKRFFLFLIGSSLLDDGLQDERRETGINTPNSRFTHHVNKQTNGGWVFLDYQGSK